MAQSLRGSFQEEKGHLPGVNALLIGEKGNKQLCHSLNLTQINFLQSTTLSPKETS